jgi:hypothetical protein
MIEENHGSPSCTRTNRCGSLPAPRVWTANEKLGEAAHKILAKRPCAKRGLRYGRIDRPCRPGAEAMTAANQIFLVRTRAAPRLPSRRGPSCKPTCAADSTHSLTRSSIRFGATTARQS